MTSDMQFIIFNSRRQNDDKIQIYALKIEEGIYKNAIYDIRMMSLGP
jgi:hypothetical protein